MVKIKIINYDLKDVWDLQTAKYLLDISGLGGMPISSKVEEDFKKKITLYLWEQIKLQFPNIEKFCNGKTGGFNKCDKRNYNTPIINIFGSFYMQLIARSDKDNWIWTAIELEPYRFEFNEEGYFKNLVLEAINKSITKEDATIETYKELLDALNSVKLKEYKIIVNLDESFKIKAENIDKAKEKFILNYVDIQEV